MMTRGRRASKTLNAAQSGEALDPRTAALLDDFADLAADLYVSGQLPTQRAEATGSAAVEPTRRPRQRGRPP